MNPAVREEFTVNPHDDIYFVCATDKEVTQSSVSVYIKYPSTPKEEKNHEYLKNGILQSFYNTMLGQRVSELLQKGNPPFINGSAGFAGEIVRGLEGYYFGGYRETERRSTSIGNHLPRE